jgi:hypothetical protein
MQFMAKINELSTWTDKQIEQYSEDVNARPLGLGSLISAVSFAVGWMLNHVLVGVIHPDIVVGLNAAVQITAFGFLVDVLIKALPPWTYGLVYGTALALFLSHAIDVVDNRCTLAMENIAFESDNLPTCAVPAPRFMAI